MSYCILIMLIKKKPKNCQHQKLLQYPKLANLKKNVKKELNF